MDIHKRAEELVRASRGKLNKAEAYRELSRRGLAARRNRKAKESAKAPQHYWWGN